VRAPSVCRRTAGTWEEGEAAVGAAGGKLLH